MDSQTICELNQFTVVYTSVDDVDEHFPAHSIEAVQLEVGLKKDVLSFKGAAATLRDFKGSLDS